MSQKLGSKFCRSKEDEIRLFHEQDRFGSKVSFNFNRWFVNIPNYQRLCGNQINRASSILLGRSSEDQNQLSCGDLSNLSRGWLRSLDSDLKLTTSFVELISPNKYFTWAGTVFGRLKFLVCLIQICGLWKEKKYEIKLYFWLERLVWIMIDWKYLIGTEFWYNSRYNKNKNDFEKWTNVTNFGCICNEIPYQNQKISGWLN